MLAAEKFPDITRSCPVSKHVGSKEAEKLRAALSPLAKLCKPCLLKLCDVKNKQNNMKTICKSCLRIIFEWQAVKNKKQLFDLETLQPVKTADLKQADKAKPASIPASPEPPKRKIILTCSTLKSFSRYSSKDETIYQILSKLGTAWCRYCGTTCGVNWRTGPWGKKTLCNKHGCDYKGYGFSSAAPRLDLSSFYGETVEERNRPVIQDFCFKCRLSGNSKSLLQMCHGCPKSFHVQCHSSVGNYFEEMLDKNLPWFCSPSCRDNLETKCINFELPRKGKLPYLVSSPKLNIGRQSLSSTQPLKMPIIKSQKKRRMTEPSWTPITSAKVILNESRENIITPSWKFVDLSLCLSENVKSNEDLSDEAFVNRHSRYENMEKHTRLLSPQSLASLFNSNQS